MALQPQIYLSVLCSVMLGLRPCSLFSSPVPCQRAFYLILPTGGAWGRLEGEKREELLPSLSSSFPCELCQQGLLAGASCLFQHFGKQSLHPSEVLAGTAWPPLLSVPSASSTGLLSEPLDPSNPISKGDSCLLQLDYLTVPLCSFGAPILCTKSFCLNYPCHLAFCLAPDYCMLVACLQHVSILSF